MKRGLKKHIVLGTVLSLNLLVGSFQAVPDFKGALSTALNSSVCNNMVTQSLPGQVAMAAASVNTVQALFERFVQGKKLGTGCPVAGYENESGRKSVRIGFLTLGVNLPEPVQATDSAGAPIVDGQGKPVFASVPSLLDKVRSASLFVDGVTAPNVLKTVAALYAGKAALDNLRK